MMTNRAVWAVESLQKNGGPEAYEQVTITLGTPDPDGDATAQFRYIKAMLDLLNIRYGIGMAEKVMKP
jgi:hypothetical protein